MKGTGKVVRGSGKLAYKIIGMLFRISTFLLISYILYLLFKNFWSGKNEFGNLVTMTSEKNYPLMAYCGTALLILLYEFASLLWSFSSRKNYEDGKAHNYDTGRGFFSFILIYAGALASKLFVGMLPASPAFLTGIEGALNIYGALAATLLPLCIAGVVCSLLRKFIFH